MYQPISRKHHCQNLKCPTQFSARAFRNSWYLDHIRHPFNPFLVQSESLRCIFNPSCSSRIRNCVYDSQVRSALEDGHTRTNTDADLRIRQSTYFPQLYEFQAQSKKSHFFPLHAVDQLSTHIQRHQKNMVDLLAEDPCLPFALHHNLDNNGRSVQDSSSFWAPSLDPRNEEQMPNEFRYWRRWSNHFDRNETFRLLKYDM
jgi:hypothetical protein